MVEAAGPKLRHLPTRLHISEDNGFDIHCCKYLVIFLSIKFGHKER
jgi:hypothetical protein